LKETQLGRITLQNHLGKKTKLIQKLSIPDHLLDLEVKVRGGDATPDLSHPRD